MEKRKGYIFDVFTAFLGTVSIMAFIYIYRIGFMRFVDSVIDHKTLWDNYKTDYFIDITATEEERKNYKKNRKI